MSTSTVGRIPLAIRVDGENEMPGGSPVTLYEYGRRPPDAAGNNVFTTPADGTRKLGIPGNDNGDGGGTTVAVKVTEAVEPAPSLTEYVTV